MWLEGRGKGGGVGGGGGGGGGGGFGAQCGGGVRMVGGVVVGGGGGGGAAFQRAVWAMAPTCPCDGVRETLSGFSWCVIAASRGEVGEVWESRFGMP